MNLSNIITEIEKNDPDVFEKISDRRKVMKNFTSFGSKVALASLPFALGSMFKKAYGETTDAITDVLQFALTLEYLESAFYNGAVAASGLNSSLMGADRAAIQKVAADENAHVNFLKNTLTGLGTTPVSTPIFDFTAGNGTGTGPFSGANSYLVNYPVFLAMAQTFEDTGVRAYKGQATALMSNNDILTAALNIHSVEARHAAHIRRMRKLDGSAVPAGVDVKPWITLNQSGIVPPFDAAVQPSYNGEELTTQFGVNILNVGGLTFSAEIASESFDEPLTKAEVLAIVDPFIV